MPIRLSVHCSNTGKFRSSKRVLPRCCWSSSMPGRIESTRRMSRQRLPPDACHRRRLICKTSRFAVRWAARSGALLSSRPTTCCFRRIIRRSSCECWRTFLRMRLFSRLSRRDTTSCDHCRQGLWRCPDRCHAGDAEPCQAVLLWNRLRDVGVWSFATARRRDG